MEFTDTDRAQLNEFANYLKFKPTFLYKCLLNSNAKITLLSCGNQSGKTGSIMRSYVDRILGFHPIAKKNIVYYECEQGHAYSPTMLPKERKCAICGAPLKLHERNSRAFRFCAETLPGQSHNTNEAGKSAEVKNTQYPELKKWLPASLIKKDITFRNPSMIIRDPYGGDDIVVEFVSYNQSVQSVAGTQRVSVGCDEAPSMDFYQEQLPRLIAEDGDIMIGYTPVDICSWLFDSLFDRARIYYRSQAVVDYLNAQFNVNVPMIDTVETGEDIAVIQTATDDNPTLKSEAIESLFATIHDPDTMAIRRYGLFKQLSGRIFKDFDYKTHFIQSDKYFPDGIPHEWVHARGVDFHPQTPWACVMMSISPTNEVFVWNELNISPERYTTREITRELALLGKDYKFRLNLIDPLAEATQKDTITIREDLNRETYNLKREGIGTGGHWQTWDTKGERGRDMIRERLKNSLSCGKPFNNRGTRHGLTENLPTLWILNNCRITADAMKNWRWEERAISSANMVKEKKNTPEQRYSHFNTTIEAIFKESSFRPAMPQMANERRYGDSYFKGRH